MTRTIRRVALVALLVGLASACARSGKAPAATTDDPWSAFRDAYAEAPTPAARVELAERFLADHPDSDRATSALAMAVYPLKDEIHDLARARALSEKALSQTTDPEKRFEIRMMLWEVSLAAGSPTDLREVAAELTPKRPLSYGELEELTDAATRAQKWSQAEEWSRAALGLSTAEAYRAENPDSKLSETQVTERAKRRRAFALAHLGWAAFNLGQADQAETAFTEAEGVTGRNFVGVASTPLDRFRGEAALLQGDLDRAEQLLAPDAVMGGDHQALADLRRIWTERKGSEAGFEEYLEATRQRLARTAVDFTLAGYDGNRVSLASTRGKVVMLAFWFPT